MLRFRVLCALPRGSARRWAGSGRRARSRPQRRSAPHPLARVRGGHVVRSRRGSAEPHGSIRPCATNYTERSSKERSIPEQRPRESWERTRTHRDETRPRMLRTAARMYRTTAVVGEGVTPLHLAASRDNAGHDSEPARRRRQPACCGLEKNASGGPVHARERGCGNPVGSCRAGSRQPGRTDGAGAGAFARVGAGPGKYTRSPTTCHPGRPFHGAKPGRNRPCCRGTWPNSEKSWHTWMQSQTESADQESTSIAVASNANSFR